MILRNRALFVLLSCVSAALIGCGGGGSSGGGGGGGGNPATAAPTATPTQAPVTPTPTATATSTPASGPTTSSYSGSSVETFTYHYMYTPQPSATSSATIDTTITKTSTDKGDATFNGASANEVQTVETDATNLETRTTTIDDFYKDLPYTGGTGVYTYGFSSSASDGEKIATYLSDVGSGNGLLDVLPETSGATWSNNGIRSIDESESDGFTAKRATLAAGAYSETDTTPQGSQVDPTPSPLIATIMADADGSGTYSFPLGGESYPNSTFAYTAPSGGKITITFTEGGCSSDCNYTYTVASWYATPLFSESYTDAGATSIPSACAVPAAYGTSGNAIVRRTTDADPVLGTLETTEETTYRVSDFPVCTVLSDITKTFYDYSGQGNEYPLGIDFSGGTSPVETDVLSATVGLVSTNASPAAHRRLAQVRFAQSRLAAARGEFSVLLEHRRLRRRHDFALHMRSLQPGRAHR